jgi:AcrR family transcriptional regulator
MTPAQAGWLAASDPASARARYVWGGLSPMRQRGSHRAGTFSAIKAAGIRLIYEHGYEAMTLRMLARSVGLESGSLYYHIKDKQDFLFRLLKEIIEGNIAALDEKLAGLEDAESQMRALICFFVTNQWEKKEESYIINSEVRSLNEENYRVISALSSDFLERVKEIVGKGVEQGKFRVRNLTVAALAVGDILSGPARWYYPRQLLALEELIEIITELIFHLLGADQMQTGAAAEISAVAPVSCHGAETQPRPGPVGFPAHRGWAR